MRLRGLLATLIVCLFVRQVDGQVAPLTLLFSTAVVEVGTSAVIDLLIDCQVDSCAAVDLTIHYDAQLVRVDQIALGELPARAGNSPQILTNQIQEESSTMTLRYITLNGGAAPNRGSGVLARISITAVAVGSAQFQFSQAIVASTDGTLYWPQTLNGMVIIEPHVSLRTVAVLTEASDPEQVTVRNMGDENPIAAERVTGGQAVIVFDPQTFFVVDAPGHLACAVSGSTASVITLHAGDINDDDQIDLLDAAIVGLGVSQSQAGNADVNGDYLVDIYDLIAVGRNYGRSSGSCD